MKSFVSAYYDVPFIKILRVHVSTTITYSQVIKRPPTQNFILPKISLTFKNSNVIFK